MVGDFNISVRENPLRIRQTGSMGQDSAADPPPSRTYRMGKLRESVACRTGHTAAPDALFWGNDSHGCRAVIRVQPEKHTKTPGQNPWAAPRGNGKQGGYKRLLLACMCPHPRCFMRACCGQTDCTDGMLWKICGNNFVLWHSGIVYAR